ncbi:uncharacterized protein LOC114447399 [Parambassis ranga]|uniref:Uncharacterized protein LOC114447399 n=1 Tax=Parambassis ranga TaxID=210632 RepID=A0A6P7JR83_9TELE|nr:uncharacterized protein LOC114447399 [Parambassis ranga]
MPEDVKHPLILAKDQHISVLISRHIHQQLSHSGRNHTLANLRKKFWITNGNSVVRKMISQCSFCRRHNGRVQEQKMADLPKERLLPDLPPFTNVGGDFFGPFNVKRGRNCVKRYGVIFTCFSSRAVHLEMAQSVDTDACINALRRFICRGGQVSSMKSDNGTNFVGAERELREALSSLNHNQIHRALLQHGIHWSFNPPTASHHGGVWERLIRMVRKVLNSVLHLQVLDEDGLNTVLCRRWRQVQYMADLFWKRWVQEYLPLLQERQKWNQSKGNLVPGDIVLLADSSVPRGSWLMERILEVFPDKKGFVRSVHLKTKTNILERLVTKLCLLQAVSNS